MMKANGTTYGVIVASLIAGPTFVAAVACAVLYAQLPAAIPVELGAVFALGFAMLLAVVFGMLIALPANGIGAVVMVTLGQHIAGARSWMAWAQAGGVLGAAAFHLFDAGPGSEPLLFATVVTSVLCATICHRKTEWIDDDPADEVAVPHRAASARTVP
jgi:hypothetical protein